MLKATITSSAHSGAAFSAEHFRKTTNLDGKGCLRHSAVRSGKLMPCRLQSAELGQDRIGSVWTDQRVDSAFVEALPLKLFSQNLFLYVLNSRNN
jgi:hypothetical protein